MFFHPGSFSVSQVLWSLALPGVAWDLFTKPWKPLPVAAVANVLSEQLWHVCIQKTSLGIQPAFLNHGGRLLSSPSHHGASDEFVTSGPTEVFEGPVSHSPTAAGSSDAEWPRKSSTAPPDGTDGRNALCYDLINASWSMTEVRSLPPLWCSVSLGIRCVPLPPLVWIYRYFPMLRFISCAAEQRQVVRITNPATCL